MAAADHPDRDLPGIIFDMDDVLGIIFDMDDVLGIIFDMDDVLGTLGRHIHAIVALTADPRAGLSGEGCEGASQVAWDALQAWEEVRAMWEQAYAMSRGAGAPAAEAD